MRANKLKFLAIAFCSLVSVLCPETQCTDAPEQTTYQKMKSLLDEHLRVNDSLLHSSKDQDIVVVLGATGSGKSTLINYLMGVELKVKPNEDIELVDPNNPLAMRIGHKGSQTLLPQCTTIDNLVFYDLPGFKDTRGTVINILASSFIKHIIEGARSTRLVFVTGQDQITSGRGESLDFSIEVSKKLFPENINIIKKSSLLVITKSINNTPETLMEYLEDKVEDMGKLALWSNTNCIFPMPKNNFELRQREIIINKINQITASKINKINIEAVYSSDVKSELKDIISSEMKHFMEQVIDRAPKDYTTVVSISKAKEYFSGKFEEDILQEINASSITILLKPLSETIFESERQEILRLIAQGRDLKIRDIEIHIKDIISSEMNRFMKQVLGQASKDHQTIESVSQAEIYFSGCFENDVLQKIDESLITTLLKPLSEPIYISERQEILRLIAQDRQLELAKLDVKKAQIEKAERDEKDRLDKIRRDKEKAEQNERDRLAAIEKAKQDEIIRKQQEQIRLVAIEQQKIQQQLADQKKAFEESNRAHQDQVRIAVEESNRAHQDQVRIAVEESNRAHQDQVRIAVEEQNRLKKLEQERLNILKEIPKLNTLRQTFIAHTEYLAWHKKDSLRSPYWINNEGGRSYHQKYIDENTKVIEETRTEYNRICREAYRLGVMASGFSFL
jgi:energy-coupling factor transporter ATP-binding protein EcfA2